MSHGTQYSYCIICTPPGCPKFENTMTIIANVSVMIVAAIHLFIAYKEFLGRNDARFYDRFNIKLAEDQVAPIGRIIANAAIFNALLGVGLIVSLMVGAQGHLLKIYLLISIITAGIVGGVTLSPRVFALQSAPAAVAVILVLLAA